MHGKNYTVAVQVIWCDSPLSIEPAMHCIESYCGYYDIPSLRAGGPDNIAPES